MKQKPILFFCIIFLAIMIASCQVSAEMPAPPSSTSVPSATQTATPSPSPTFTPSPTSTPTQTATATITPPPTASPTATPSGELITLDNLDQVQALETWEFIETYMAHGPFIAWVPDNSRFGILAPDKILEYQIGTRTALNKVEFSQVVAGLTYTHDGTTLLTSAHGVLIEYADPVKREIQKPPCNGYGDIAISPDDNFIVTKSRLDGDLYLSLWTYPDYTCVGNLFQYDAPGFLNMAFSPDSQFFAALAGSNLKIWNINTQQIACEIKGYGGIVAFSPDGTLGIGSGEDFSLWDPSTCQIVTDLENLFGKSESIQAISWSPDGSILMFSNLAGPNLVRLHFWDVAMGEMKMMLEIDSTIIDQLVFSPNGHYFLTSSQEVYGETPAQVTLWGIK